MRGRRRIRSAALAALLSAAAACAPRLEPAGPAIGPPHITGDALVAADGAALPLRRWLPDAPPRAVVLGLHGFNDYSNAFADPGAYWATQGIATYAYDQRGFGAGPHPRIWAGRETLAADAATAAALLRARHPDTPLFVVGESMGGAVAIVAAAEAGLRAEGLVLSAPALRGRRYIGAVPRAALWLFSRLIPGYPLTGQGLGIRPSDNIPMLRALGADPLVIKQTRIDAVRGLVDLMDAALDDAPRLATPTLILYGARDELIPEGPTFDTIRVLPADGSHRAAVYRNGWHMLLRDLGARTVLDDIVAWIADRAAPLPSGADRTAARALAGATGDGAGAGTGVSAAAAAAAQTGAEAGAGAGAGAEAGR